MDSVLIDLLRSYGYAILFLLVGLESLGIPLPGETALIMAAAFAASGHMSIFAVVATAAAAAILGDSGGYWIGRKGGLALVRRYGRYIGLDEAKIARAHTFFQRYGARTVFIGRFIALLRTWAAVLAGIGEMKYSTFMLFNVAGGITWAVTFGTLGYAFGRNLQRLEHYMREVSFAVILVAVLMVSVAGVTRWFRAYSAEISGLIKRVANSDVLEGLRGRYPRAYGSFVRRLEPAAYIGLQLAVVLLISLSALWLYGKLTGEAILDVMLLNGQG